MDWTTPKGPIASAVLSMQRIGWRTDTESIWTDDLGIERDISEYSPKLMAIFLRDSVHKQLERSIAAAIGDPTVGERICLDIARSYVFSGKHARKAKIAVESAATNALWPKTRLKEAGYVVEDTRCQMCWAAEDTIHHRLAVQS